MERDQLVRLLFLALIFGIPVLRWVFKQLFLLTQRANRFAQQVEQGERNPSTRVEQGRVGRDSRRSAVDEGAWEHVADIEQDHRWEQDDADRRPQDRWSEEVEVRETERQPKRRPPRVGGRSAHEVQRFLDELAGITPPRQPVAASPVPRRAAAAVPPVPAPYRPTPAPDPVELAPLSQGELGAEPRRSQRRRSAKRRRELGEYIRWSEIIAKPVALRDPSVTAGRWED